MLYIALVLVSFTCIANLCNAVFLVQNIESRFLDYIMSAAAAVGAYGVWQAIP